MDIYILPSMYMMTAVETRSIHWGSYLLFLFYVHMTMSATVAVGLHIGLLAAQFLLLAGPPFAGRNGVVVLVVLGMAAAVHVAGPTSPHAADAQPYTLLWPVYLSTIEKAVSAARSSSTIEASYWRRDRGPSEAARLSAFGWAKSRWAAALLVNPRLVRWNLEAKNVPSPPVVRGRLAFVALQTVALVKMVLVTDFLLQMGIRLFWTPSGPDTVYADSKHLTIGDASLPWSFVKTLVFACGPYFFMNMQYVAVSLIAVLLRLSQPVVCAALSIHHSLPRFSF